MRCINSLKLPLRVEFDRITFISPLLHDLGLPSLLLKIEESLERELLQNRGRLPQHLSHKMNVLCCGSCKMYQVHIIKNLSKWTCQKCHVKNSVKQICFQGPRSDCRNLIQKLNKEANHTVSIPSRRDDIGATYNPFVNYYKESGNDSGVEDNMEYLKSRKMEDRKDVENLMCDNEANDITSSDTSSESEDDGDTSSEGEDVSNTSSKSKDVGETSSKREDVSDTSCESKDVGNETEGLRTTSFNCNSNIDDECNMKDTTKSFKFNDNIDYLAAIIIEDLYRKEFFKLSEIDRKDLENLMCNNEANNVTSSDTSSESEDDGDTSSESEDVGDTSSKSEASDTSCESKDVGNETEGLRTTSFNRNSTIDDECNMKNKTKPSKFNGNIIRFILVTISDLLGLKWPNLSGIENFMYMEDLFNYEANNVTSSDTSSESEDYGDTSSEGENVSDTSSESEDVSDTSSESEDVSDTSSESEDVSDTSSESEDVSDTSCESKDVGNETEG